MSYNQGYNQGCNTGCNTGYNQGSNQGCGTGCGTTKCPLVSVITSATAPFAVLSTPITTAPIPIPVGATSIPANSTIVPISGAALMTRPEVSSGGIRYTPRTGQFTIPVSGTYLISAYVSFPATIGTLPGSGILSINDIRAVYIYRVHSATGRIVLLAADTRNSPPIGPTRVTVTITTNLTVGDHIFFAVAQNTGAIINIFTVTDPANRFAITRIC